MQSIRKMDCFSCFTGGPVEKAATTIGRYYRGNVARGERKRLEARKALQTAGKKVIMIGILTPRDFKVSDDELTLIYMKPGPVPSPEKALPFADMATVLVKGPDVRIAMKSGKNYKYRFASHKHAQNVYYGLSAYVDPKALGSPVPAALVPV
jgi:hypothetical protein